MENSPLAAKADVDRKEARKPKSRKPETIGSLAVKPKLPERGGLEHSPAASELHGIKAPEHIGHMLIDSEAKPATRNEKSAPETDRSSKLSDEKPVIHTGQPATEKRIDTLSRAELLALSETIIIDGSSLRQIYETHLIGERGLRRLVAEHLHDGDLKKALRREVIEREIDFERDPIMRDMIPHEALKTSSKAAALDKLLERAALGVNDGNEEAAFFKARAIYESRQLQQHKKQRRLIDLSLAGFITVLIALVVILYLNRN